MSAPGGASICRLRDYVGAARLGAHGLVDLLAARDEARASTTADTARRPAGPGGTTRPDARNVEWMSAVIRAHLPLTPSEIGRVLVAAGLEGPPPSLDNIIQLFRERDVAVPFRALRRGGAAVLVAPDQLASAEALLTSAAHFVFNWGLCSVSALVNRVRALSTSPVDVTAASRILATIPRFRWLDEQSGWFSFAGSRGRLSLVVRNVFAVAERVLLHDLRLALAKPIELLVTAPLEAIEAYLLDVVGCEIVDGWVRPRRPLADGVLGPGEQTIVGVLHAHGGELPTPSLLAKARAAGLKPPTLLRLLRTSPLVIERGGRLRLVGEPRPAFIAAAA